MKLVLLSIGLLLLSLSNAADYVSPSQPPMLSPAREPSNSDCSSVIFTMVDCLSFLTPGSTDPSPTKSCCGGIKTVLEYNPECLCYGLESSREMGFVLDDLKALSMPEICNVPIDPHCAVVTTPAPSTPISPLAKPPVMSPTPEPSNSPTPQLSNSPTSGPSNSPTPGPSSNSDCSSVIYSMVDCLSFLTVGSTDPSPSKSCCGGIKSVLEYNPECLCSGLASSRDMGFVLDDTKALAMPKICNIPIDAHCDVEATPAAKTPISPLAKPPTTSPSSTKSPEVTGRSSPKKTATTPSPSKSNSRNLSVSKLFLTAVIVSSFVYSLA